MNLLPPTYKPFTVIVLFVFCAFAKAQSPQVTVTQNEKIETLLDLKSELTKDNKLADRYKIQVYSGSRERASGMHKKYLNKVGTWHSSIVYETPNYKVWVGNFRNRLEADRALLEVRKEFPTAFIFKPERK